MKVAIAGSRHLPAGQAPRLLVRFLAALPADATILLRHPRFKASPGPFERDVAGLCNILHMAHEWCVPAPSATTPGRSSVYLRDIDMVAQADLVILFFAPEEATDGYSGTAHLMDKALDQDRPCYAYTVAEDGVTRVGEYDPDSLFIHIAPSA
jgi:hypothetical protein